ncbi:hypothetical protein C8J57DRAFT_1236926 [Mycena rebaudengoi]|nr:hypothetical protein C8J57DRAFT_1246256 [Mycena rebaudengoi]KAJ7254203.1 hypothetical protein C8J57DRAFT_1236926 [Mycena rebaudengoi]
MKLSIPLLILATLFADLPSGGRVSAAAPLPLAACPRSAPSATAPAYAPGSWRSPPFEEAFARFAKPGTASVPREALGDLLRAAGENPTQVEVADIVRDSPEEGVCELRRVSGQRAGAAEEEVIRELQATERDGDGYYCGGGALRCVLTRLGEKIAIMNNKASDVWEERELWGTIAETNTFKCIQYRC